VEATTAVHDWVLSIHSAPTAQPFSASVNATSLTARTGMELGVGGATGDEHGFP
jgi:hypothetical protein